MARSPSSQIPKIYIEDMKDVNNSEGIELQHTNGIYDDDDDDERDAVEDASLLQDTKTTKSSEPPNATTQSNKWAVLWMGINIIATIMIVFVNKTIFSDDHLKSIQISFAAFHFAITGFAIWVLSRPLFGFFEPKPASLLQMIPLSTTMALNVIFPNLSLAHSTVAFYQIARILLTPCVASLDFMLYRTTMPLKAALSLVPACIGVGMVSYYDSRPSKDTKVKTTSELGVIFALTGVFFSSLYTVWITAFRRRFGMSSMQLLFNQAPLSAFLLLYITPFVDTFPAASQLAVSRWILIVLSGLLAVLINVSQFFIIAHTGPVSSTVVGHTKTCIIVVLGWATSGRNVADMCVFGLLVALVGILSYSYVMVTSREK